MVHHLLRVLATDSDVWFPDLAWKLLCFAAREHLLTAVLGGKVRIIWETLYIKYLCIPSVIVKQGC